MRALLPFIVIGLTTGAVYALASLGLVLTYRTSAVFNFAHGAIGMVAAYAFYSLRQHVPTPLAVVVAVFVVAPLIGAAVDGLFRRLSGAGATPAIVASLGLLVGLQGLAVVIYGPETRQVKPFLPTGTVELLDVRVGFDQTIVVALALLAALGLVVFFRTTHLGLQTRAVVDNRALSGLVGTNSPAITRFSWMLGCAFAAASGILFSLSVGLDSILLTLLVVQAFGAAAVGRLQSFPITVLAAFGIGVAQAIATKVVGDLGQDSLRGLPNTVPFLVLFGSLLLSRRGQLREPETTRVARPSRWTGSRFRLPTKGVLAAGALAAVLPPFLNSSQILTLSFTVAFVLLFGSLSLLVGLSRQLSLCHAIFVVLGATTLSHLMDAGVPYLLALPLSALLLTPVGAALALPAIRLSGLYLGLATLGFGILAESLVYPTQVAFGLSGVLRIERPTFLGGSLAFYYFTLAVVLVGVAVVEFTRVTRLGKILTGLADSPRAVGSLGISPLAARLVAFCLSAFLAGLAGGLLGSLVQSVNASSFSFFSSLLWVTVLVATGAQTFGGVLLAAVVLIAVPAVFTAPWISEWQPVLFGAAAIVLAQESNGLIGTVRGFDFTSWAQSARWRLGSRRRYERLVPTVGIEAAATAGPGPVERQTVGAGR